MNFVFDNKLPVYLQLLEQLRVAIVTGRFLPGEKLPSVREIALEAKINPNTVQKALTELEAEGLIYTERTNGKFVSSDTEVIAKTKALLASEALANYFRQMKNLGFSKTEAMEYLSTTNKEENDDSFRM